MNGSLPRRCRPIKYESSRKLLFEITLRKVNKVKNKNSNSIFKSLATQQNKYEQNNCGNKKNKHKRRNETFETVNFQKTLTRVKSVYQSYNSG